MYRPKFACLAAAFMTVCAFAQTQPIATLTVSDEATNPSGIGRSVAMSGSIVAAGAPLTTVNGHASQGAVDIFTKAPSAPWTNMTESARLVVANGYTNSGLGFAVAISGDGNVIAATDAGEGCWIFLKPAAGWTGTINAVGFLEAGPMPRPWIVGGAADPIAMAMNATGTMIVLGYPNTSYKAHISNRQHIPAAPNVGSAYIWVEPATGWANLNGIPQTAIILDPDGVAYDSFGTSVGIAANTVVVGAPVVSKTFGAAYVFQMPSSGWLPLATKPVAVLTASDGATQDRLGTYVAVGNGGSLIALATANGCLYPGAAYVYAKATNVHWPAQMTQTAELTPYNIDGVCFGQGLALDRDLVIVGAYNYGARNGNDGPGADYSFAKPATGWANMSLPPSMAANGSLIMGFSNSVGGRSIAAGGAQAIYVFNQ